MSPNWEIPSGPPWNPTNARQKWRAFGFSVCHSTTSGVLKPLLQKGLGAMKSCAQRLVLPRILPHRLPHSVNTWSGTISNGSESECKELSRPTTIWM
jgi:hypothetical protein